MTALPMRQEQIILRMESVSICRSPAPYPQAPRLLLLHGWLDNLASFFPLWPHLAKHFELVAIDLPGHGRSPHRGITDAYHAVDWMPVVLQVLDRLGWARCGLIGHSMGAAIATLVAGSVPERFWALVCLDLLGPFATPIEALPQALADRYKQGERRASRPLRPYRTRAHAAISLAKVVNKLSLASAELLVERGMREVEGGFVWSADQKLRVPQVAILSEAQIRAFFARIACPLLFVRAPDGLALDEHILSERLAVLPHGRRVDIDGGHHVHMERPIDCAAAVISFLQAASQAHEDGPVN